MEQKLNPDFQAFEQNIIDFIKEEQIKLGYSPETIRLYYPAETILNLLGIQTSDTLLNEVLDQFRLFTKDRLGDVNYTENNGRYCIIIPPEGVIYIHDRVEDSPFLQEFIDKIRDHHVSIEDLVEVFQHHSDNVKFEKITNGEFDYLLYFEDGKPDAYRYCIKSEEGHTIYHRFTQLDYNKFDFS
jgi:hypothetical protein